MIGTETACTLRQLGNFAPMSVVHLGKVLRELYLKSGLKMDRFRLAVDFSAKTIYYHFGQEDLHTSILDRYEDGLRSLGMDVDLWELIARRRRAVRGEADPAGSVVAEPVEPYGHPASVADLLRRAAALLEQGPAAPPALPPAPKPQE